MQEELEVDNSKGKVKTFCEKFLLKADESLAYQLQNKEFETHYDKNRKERKNIRQDLPVAKSIFNEEYQDLLKKHQMLEEIEKRDAELAIEYQKMYIEELERVKEEQKRADEELAKKLQENYVRPKYFMDNKMSLQEQQDYELARYLQAKEQIKLDQQLNHEKSIKSSDEELAKLIQQKEENLKCNNLTSPSLGKSKYEKIVIKRETKLNLKPYRSSLTSSTETMLSLDYSKTLNEQLHEDHRTKTEQFDLNALQLTDNIVATIDPTFKRRFSTKDIQTMNRVSHNKCKTLDRSQEKSILLSSLYNLSDDSAYLPIQGHRRTKSTANIKKKSNGCLQQ